MGVLELRNHNVESKREGADNLFRLRGTRRTALDEMMRALPDTVAGNVQRLRELADEMSNAGSGWAIEIHALAIDLAEGLNLDKEERK